MHHQLTSHAVNAVLAASRQSFSASARCPALAAVRGGAETDRWPCRGGSTGGSVSDIVAGSLRDRCGIVAGSLRRRTLRAFSSLFHTSARFFLFTWPLPNFSATRANWWGCPSNSPACICAWAKGRGERATVRHTMVGQLCSALARYSLRRCTSASTYSFPNPCWSQLQVKGGG